ncbi:MAG: RNA polymerase sigma factor [Capnocytophaga sp.]|nr:RNA polymerase sigma factor [Capnocytophaga sp.]
MKQKTFLERIVPFQDKVFRFAKRLLISKEEAQDVSQEVWLRMWKQFPEMDTVKNWEAFAMTMTRNLCLDRLKAKSSSNLSLSQSPLDTDLRLTHERSLAQEIENNDMVRLLQRCIDMLPEQQRTVIQLRDIEQYEFDEIEKITAIKAATVRVLLSRARKNLRAQMMMYENN